MRKDLKTRFTWIALFATLAAISSLTDNGPLMLGGGSAEAVIGRPLTPMSYAGVARRTTRRAAYAGAYAAPVVPSTSVVTTLPSGCAGYTCGGVQYQPAYNGTTVVYQRY